MAFEHNLKLQPPADAWQRPDDIRQRHEPLVSPERTGREQPGLNAKVRGARLEKWMYAFCTPDMLKGEPPAHVLAQFEEELGDLLRDEDGRLRLRIAWHPIMNRWCTFSCVKRPDLGEAGTLWQVIFIHMEDPRPGYLPSDLRAAGIERWHLTGFIGDYSLPTREDFKKIRKYSARHEKLGTHVDRLNRLSHDAQREERESADELYQRGRAAADYSANYEIDAANRRAGSGWRMRETFIDDKGIHAVGHKEDTTRYVSVQKEGYRIIERRRQWEDRLEKEATQKLAAIRTEAEERKQRYAISARSLEEAKTKEEQLPHGYIEETRALLEEGLRKEPARPAPQKEST